MKQIMVQFEQAMLEDADELASLRVAAMRDSLVKLGRFDETRARRRLLDHYDPSCTWHLVVNAKRVGVLVMREHETHLLLDHLYLYPSTQGLGIGSAAVTYVIATAQQRKLPVQLIALKQSPANAFYLKHGFTLIKQDEWDNYYEYQHTS